MIETLSVENFCQFPGFKVKIGGLGLCWVGGKNEDSEGASNNGAGKSNFLGAIGWVLYGQMLGLKDPDRVIRDGEKEASGTLTLSGGWRITRKRKKGKPRLFLVDPKGEPFAASKEELQVRINKLVGLDWDAFRSTALYGQRDARRFLSPSTTDVDRKKVLHTVLRTSLLLLAHRWIKDGSSSLATSLSRVESEIDRREAGLSELDTEFLRESHEKWLSLQKEKIAKAKEELASLREALSKLKVPRDRGSRKVVEKLKVARAELQEAEALLQKRSDASSEIRGRLKAHTEDASYLKEDECPTCGAHIDPGKKKKAFAVLSNLKEALEAAMSLWRRTKKLVSEKEDVVRSLLSEKKALEEAARARQTALEKAERLGEQISKRKELVISLRAEESPYVRQLASVRKRRRELSSEIETLKAERKEISVDRAHWEFWRRGLSPSGFPSFVFDSVMPTLTARANHYLKTLADGDITMAFDTQRELKKSSEKRDQISISWTIEGVENYTPSGGQWRKMEVATDLALMDVVETVEDTRVPVLFLDECLDGLDAEGRRRMVRLLHELRSSRSTIFVVSHDETMAEIFDRSFLVTKRGGVSTVEAS